MTKRRSTKRALLLSALSLLMCVSMLIGSTFAWFTDSVTSGKNKIMAGNLDVELYYQNEATSDWTKIEENSNIFMEGALWEPGHTEVIKLKVVNEGSLALKYQFAISILEETLGINQDNAIFRLSDFIQFNLLDEELADDISRADAVAEAADGAKKLSSKHTKSSELLSKKEDPTKCEDIVTLVVWMPESVGNDANHKTGTAAPVIKLGLDVFATQYTHESDSFGSDYDKDAYWTGDVNTNWYNTTDSEFTLVTAEQLAGLAEIVNNGTDSFLNKTIKLGANIDLNNIDWTPIGTNAHPFKGTFIGTGYTISNLYVTGTAGVGLFGYTFTGAHIEGVTVNKAYVSGNDYVGTILGKGYLAANCLKNCTVTEATVIATPFQREDGQYDGGTKAGVIAGYALNGNVTGNKAYNSTVTAYRDLGGIVGMLAGDGIGSRVLDASGNEANGITLNYIGVAGAYYEGKVNGNMNEIVGRIGASTQLGENTIVDVTKNAVNEKVAMIFTLQDLLTFANEVNNGNTYAGKTVLLGDNIDLNNMEWTPIGTGAGFNGIFDGNGKTISNLKITGNKSTVGFFANTYNGEIKNLTIENASVSGRLNVGVVAGNPYTSKYTNITVKGHVEVNGFAYVGGVGGKNAYADWTNITVEVDDTSYVKAISTENDKPYRTYVGGVIGFMGEGGHTVKNVKSNIDVIGDVCDIGGIVGIAHYNNKFENIECTGNVTGTYFDPEWPEDADEIGGIAGVWHNQNGTTVTFTDCVFTGKLTAASASVDVSNNTITGKAYSSTGTGELIIVNYVAVDGITYAKDGVTGESALYLVPADYENDTVTVAEGTTAIGNYAFAYNNNVKTVVLASTVTDLGRGFDSSKVEKVVLNKGLKTISSRAFRETTQLKEVVIPSTVTEIADNAFQKSGIKVVTIPATVKTIGETAFGASLIEEVIFEGDIAIQGYAFRGCMNLRTVWMNGYNVTFVPSTLNGRNSTWFCNGESNNPNTSEITFYVKNDIIKERVLTAMGAERNNTDVYCTQTVQAGGYFTDEQGNAHAYDAEGLVAALEAGKSVTLYEDAKIDPAGMSNAYGTTGINVKNGQTIDGMGNTLDIKGAGGTWDSGISTTGGLIKNITVTGSFRGIFINHNSTHSEKVILENVIIDGTTYTISCDQGSGNGLKATNSTFKGWTSYAATLGKAEFENCTFGAGNGYSFCRPYAETSFVNCDFEAGYRMDPRANVTFENCTIGGEPLTAENLATLVYTNTERATVK